MERIVKLDLSEEEEKLLETLVKHCNSIGFQKDSESVLSDALLAGGKWDTYVYEKLASYLLLMGGCKYEEYDNLLSAHKQQLDNEYKQFQAEKNAQRVSKEKVVKQSEFKEQVDCDSTKLYDVSFEKNGIGQSNLVRTNKDIDTIKDFFKQVKGCEVYGVRETTPESMKPGKPIVSIPEDYQCKVAKVQNMVKQLYEAQSLENEELEPEQ